MPKTGSSGAPAHLVQVQKSRKKQIDKLKQLKFGVTSLQHDVQYKVDFTLKKDSTAFSYHIKIDLPPCFPADPPVLFVQPPCSHEYLDAAQVVINFPPLENFKSKQDLASVVKKLIAEFEKNPPIPLILDDHEKQQQEELLKSYTPQYPSLTSQFVPNVVPPDIQSLSPVTTQSHKADLPETIPELEDLTAEELKELDEDEMKLLGVFHSTESAKQISKEREEISKRIEAIANENLSRSNHLEKCREKLVERFDKCQKLKEEYDKNVKRFAEASEWTSLHNLSLTLQVSAAEEEQKAEKMVQNFLDGNTDVMDFTKEFVKTKTVAATRKAQEDKIQHILGSQ